jgi:hypothetical protein
MKKENIIDVVILTILVAALAALGYYEDHRVADLPRYESHEEYTHFVYAHHETHFNPNYPYADADGNPYDDEDEEEEEA